MNQEKGLKFLFMGTLKQKVNQEGKYPETEVVNPDLFTWPAKFMAFSHRIVGSFQNSQSSQNYPDTQVDEKETFSADK